MSERKPEILNVGGTLHEFVPIEVLEREHERLWLQVEFGERHLNRGGNVHGGYISALLDVAVAAGANAAPVRDPRAFGVTLSLNVSFLQPVPVGLVYCRTTVIGGGRRTKFVEAVIETPTSACDEAGTRLAVGIGTVKITTLPEAS